MQEILQDLFRKATLATEALQMSPAHEESALTVGIINNDQATAVSIENPLLKKKMVLVLLQEHPETVGLGVSSDGQESQENISLKSIDASFLEKLYIRHLV